MTSLVDSLCDWAVQRPDAPVYRFLETGDVDGPVDELSFQRLARRARAIGGWLQARGFSGSRALLLYPPGLDFAGGFMGCLFGGVLAAPSPAAHPSNLHRELPRLKSLVANAGAELVLSTKPVLSAMLALAGHVPELARLTWVATEDIPDEAQDEWWRPNVHPESTAFLQYTSGSTSAPRGVMVTHGNLADQQRLLTECFGHAPDVVAAADVLLVSWLPAFHDMGLIAKVLHPLHVGGTTVMFSPGHFVQKPERWLLALSRYGARTSCAPNFAYELCARRARPELIERLDLGRWRFAGNGGEPVRASTIRRFAEVFAPAGFRPETFHPGYGLAEATLAVSVGSRDREPRTIAATDSANRELVSVGPPVPGMSVEVVDPARAVPLPDGEIGEIWVAGASVAQGYWHDREATEETFDARLADGRAGYLRTGDLGLLRDGELYVAGRAKDLLVIDGRNHYPQDLELTAETAHPAVRPGCVAAFSVDGEDGERPVVVAEVNPEPATDSAAVETAIREAIVVEHGLALRSIALIAPRTIRKTSSGKIQRRATRAAYLDGSLALLEPPTAEAAPAEAAPAEAAPAPPSDVEAWLVAATAREAELDRRQIELDRPIAEYGIGSRALAQIVGELSTMLGREVAPTLLYDHPTIAQAAKAIGGAADDAPVRPPPSSSSTEPIAIVSMACRFPAGVSNPEELWRLLAAGEDAVGDPPRRWDVDALYDPDPAAAGKAYTLQGGFLRDVDRFDAAFFGISPREAATMDPQQRLLLQTSWEALERAGIRPQQLSETATGVYVGLYDSGYASCVGLEQLDGHTATGSAASVASGRVAYTLGLQGPAVTVDTACSSSLVSVHMAGQALRGGECDLALAGGATVMATPRAFVEFSRLRGLSPSGRCRPFSAAADGIVWAEGCGLLLLKRLSDAERDGDRVLGLIIGSAVNQDGRSQGLSAPNGLAQERVVRAALDAAEVRPEEVDYVEAHGTGTPLGDPIEGRALTRVFGSSRPRDRPLYVGSAKSNLGHAQAAAGVAGMMKTVLALQHEQLPPSLHGDDPTPRVDWGAGLQLLSEARPWRRGARVRRAGVSSFGISGTNAHLILEEGPERRPSQREGHDGEPTLFPVSARSSRSLSGQAGRLAAALTAEPSLELRSVARTLACHRTHFERRAVVVARRREDLVSGLRGLASGEPEPELVRGPREGLVAGQLAFVFPGQGAQWTGMATDLLACSSAFAEELRRCDAALGPYTGWSVASVLRGEDGAPDLRRVDVVQPVLFAVMVSLAAVWRSFGVEPDAVVGHSQGEVAAACVAGALSLEDAAKVVALRGRALSVLGGSGAMAVVELPHADVERRLAQSDGGVSVAAINSARTTVLAGDVGGLEALLAGLERENVFVRRIQVDYAAHSAAVEPLRGRLPMDLAGIAWRPPSVPWYSTVLGEPVDAQRLGADYWYRNLREPVRFARAAERMCVDGFRFFVELSPHPSLLISLETIAEDTGQTAVVVGSLRRDAHGRESLMRSLADLHVAGRDLPCDRLAAKAPPVELPTYAFEEQRHWIEPNAGGGATVPAGGGHPLLGTELQSAGDGRWIFRRTWSARTTAWLREHRVFGQVVMSGTAVMELCQAALDVASPDRATDVNDLLLVAPIVLPETDALEVQVEVAGADVSVYSRPRGADPSAWTLHATAVAAVAVALPADPPPPWPDPATPVWTDATYARLDEAGLSYGPTFQGVQAAVSTGAGQILARLSLPAPARDTAAPGRAHPALLDAALQVAATLDTPGRVLVPVAAGRCSLPRRRADDLTAAVTVTSESDNDRTVDVALWDDDGLVAGRLSGVRVRSLGASDFSLGPAVARDLYAVHWTPMKRRPATVAGGSWAVVADAADPVVAAALEALREAGAALTAVAPGDKLPPDVDAVIRCWPGAGPDADLAERAQALTAAGLTEIASLVGGARPRIVWLTSGAVATGTGDESSSLAASPLWGLARSARTEHPNLGLHLVDVDAAPAAAALAEALLRADEPELAVRGEAVLAPRLVRAPAGDEPQLSGQRLAPIDGTVLITGGLGALGARIARRLAEHGVPRLLLTSRRGEQDSRSAKVVAELSALGADVEVAACDVADAAALADLVHGIDEKLPLRGVVHGAGVLADGVITEQTPEQLAEVMRPKIAGAWNLHRLTLEEPIELFALLSSAAGVLGTAGQSNYAAATVFLDQLAHRRRALGLPATSVAFGPWAGGGLAEHSLDRAAGLGFTPLAPDHGLDLLELAVRRRAPHLVALAVDLERVERSALWRTLLPEAPAGPVGDTLVERLAPLNEAERAERVLAMVNEEAARALGLGSGEELRPNQPLGEVGLDSVTALELRNRLSARFGTRLTATLLFDHPAPADLAGHLLRTVVKAPDQPAAKSSPETAARAAPRPVDEPVAIVSMACRVPGGVADPDQLWQLLAEGRDAIGPFPADRWDVESLYDPDPDATGKSYTREGGFLPRIDAFDPSFFGIAPREAMAMDPQQRLLLETAWEALERVGIVPETLVGSVTGVYLGMLGSDYAAGSSLNELDGYLGTGTALSVASGRLAYTLGLVGPALTVDTACSSSLLALHLAVAGLRSGECEMALVGGATVMATPRTFVEFSRLRGLSPSGRCRSFSDDTDGTGFSEGVAMVVVKRLSDARRDGDDVLAVVRGTAVSQDGRSQGLSVPFGPSQERVIREALERSSLTPADIDYVEAHGTGTTLGDPIEANALAGVFGSTRPPGRPLRLGSIKSNVGHLQAAAGLAGVMKAVLALRHEQLPPTLHVTRPTRHVEWDESGLQLVREPLPWPREDRPRRAGVSAFGISGTNVHVIVEEAPQAADAPTAAPPAREHLFLLSARDDAALARQAGQLAAHVAATPDAAPPDVAYTLARHRTHFERRAAVLAEDREALLAGLDALAAGRPGPDVVLPPAGEPITGKVAFVFPGHSRRWVGMGRDLLEQSELFAAALERCDEAIGRHVDWSVGSVLRGRSGAPDVERPDVTQPLLFALDCALAELWRPHGVEPDAVIGHSFGEIAAAHVAGALTLDQAAAIVTQRGRSVQPVAGRGGALSVELPPAEVEERLASFAGRLSVAAVNSRRSTTVSGDVDALAELQGALDAEGAPARRVPVAFAVHSHHMDAVGDDLRRRLADVAGVPTAIALYSTVLGERVAGDALDAGYWVRNLREPVRFADTVRRMLDDGYRHFVEVAPHPALGPSIEAVAADAGVAAAAVGSLRRDEDGGASMLRNLARLAAAGHDPDWSKAFPAGSRVALPTYAFARERFWSSPASAAATGPGDTPFVRTHVEASDEPSRDTFETEVDLRDPRFAYLSDHVVAGAVWLPASAFLEMAFEAAGMLGADPAAALAGVRFQQPLPLPDDASVRLQLVVAPAADDGGARAFTIASRPSGDRRAPWTSHVVGTLLPAGAETAAGPPELIAAQQARCADPVEMAGVYDRLAGLGIEYGEAFRRVERGWSGQGEAVARLAEAPPTACVIEPPLLDAAFHTAALPADVPAAAAFVPAKLGRVRLGGVRTAPAWVTCRVRSARPEAVVLDLRLLDAAERLVVELEGVELAPLSQQESSVFAVEWKPRPPAAGPPARGPWLILADESGVGAALGDRLGDAPHVVARRGTRFSADGPGCYRIDPNDPTHLHRLLEEAFRADPPTRIVDLLALDAPPIDSAEAMGEAATLCCTAALRLVGVWRERSWTPAPRLFLVTRASQAAGGSAEVTCPQQALGWGFGAAVGQEHPELRTTLIDLPAHGGVDALWAQLRHADDELWVALRAAGRFVPRLVPARIDGADTPLPGDRAYLVVGGLGGLGRVAAERLTKRGARHLALVGRSEPTAAATEWMQALRGRGIRVRVLRADVADRAAMAAALSDLRRGAPPIGGIVHAAGVVDDATLATLTPDRIARVLAPKVRGTALLSELVPEADFLILFSSAAGLLGSAGQSSYSAANAFLDAWAHHLAADNRPALSLDWGAWADIGLVAESDVRTAAMARTGLRSFSAEEGGDLFERVMASGRRQLVPLGLDRALMSRRPELVASRPLLADLVVRSSESRAQGDLVRRVRAAAGAEERTELVETYLRGALAAVTGADEGDITPTTPFEGVGVDSLMRVTLNNAVARDLGVELPARAATAAADIRALAGAILEALAAGGPAAAASEPAATAPAAVPDVERRPATRDVMRLLRGEEQGIPSVTHNIGFAARLGVPTTRERLTEILAGVAGRHAALRTAIVPDPEHRRALETRRRPSGPLLRWTAVDDDIAVDERLRALMEPPFDLTRSPLWRFELLENASGEQVLLYGAHHAVSDGASLVLVVAEIGAELSGTRLEAIVSNRDVDLLLQAQLPQAPAERDMSLAEWSEQVCGCRRLDLELARPRPATRSFRAGTLFVGVPGGLLARVDGEADRLGITPAAFCLGTLAVLLSRMRDTSRFVMAVPVDTRMHAGTLDAVGFFGVPIPFAAEVAAGEPVIDVLRRTDGRLDSVLEKGVSFVDAMPALVAQNLHRPGAPLVEVYFNYIRPQALKARGVEVLPAGSGYSDLDLMVSVSPDLGHVRLDYNLDILDEKSCTQFGREYLRLLDEVATDPTAPAAPAPAPRAATAGSVAVGATCALGNLPDLLGIALGGGQVDEAPYHHVLASLLDPAGVFDKASTATGVALIRGSDLGRFGPMPDDLLAELAEEYPAALHAVIERTGVPVIAGFLPDQSEDARLHRWVRDLAVRLERQPGLVVIRPDDWTRGHPVDERFDEKTDAIAHLPFTLEFQAAVALKLADCVRAIRRRPPKVIAVDGDETLWGGVAGEIGPEHVELGGPRATLARRLLEWRAAGVLLALTSNNDEATVRAVLERPDSVLQPEHFTVIAGGWEPKFVRIEAMADRLRLGLDGFLYLDDNPVEIAAVRSELPEVMCVTCPGAEDLEEFVKRLWPIVPRAATREDAARADFYRQEEDRRLARERTSFAEFLARLQLGLDVEPLSDGALERSVQLTRRTNQFNLRPGAYDQAALTTWQQEGEVWTASARDRFGDYGQIGVVALRRDGDTLEVVAWMLSCRVLGRGVEEQLLHWLADRADALDCPAVRLIAERTTRNVPARRLVAALGGGDVDLPRLCATRTPSQLRAFRSWDVGSREPVGAHHE
jgi:FkbH-like protein